MKGFLTLPLLASLCFSSFAFIIVGSHLAGKRLNDCTLQKRDSTLLAITATGLLSYLSSDEK